MPATPASPAQTEARRQAQRACREVDAYRRLLPYDNFMQARSGICRSDGWNLSCQWLNGEFDLDEIFARDLAARLLRTPAIPKEPSFRNLPSPSPSPKPQPAMPTAEEMSWLQQYLDGETTGEIGSLERFASEARNALIGPASLPGNANSLKQIANATVQSHTEHAVLAAARRIESGAARSVKINRYMTLYDANPSGKGRLHPRIRITGLPVQVVTPTLGPDARMAASGAHGPMRAADILPAQKLGRIASEAHWSGRLPFLDSKLGGGILTFLPSAALDLFHSIDRDTNGKLRFNRHDFLVASTQSQSGNLVGMGGGLLVTAGAVALNLGPSAIIVASWIFGIGFSVLWSSWGGTDWAGTVTERALRP